MGHGKNALWALIVDMWPWLIMLATTGLVGGLLLGTTFAKLKQWRGGKFYRLFLAVILIELIVGSAILVWRKMHA